MDLSHWINAHPDRFLQLVLMAFFLKAIASFLFRRFAPRRTNLRTMPYKIYLQTPQWRGIRQRKFRQSGYRCQRCHSRKRLQVHHLTYVNRGNEPLRDLMVLCDGCHRRVHGK